MPLGWPGAGRGREQEVPAYLSTWQMGTLGWQDSFLLTLRYPLATPAQPLGACPELPYLHCQSYIYLSYLYLQPDFSVLGP